MTETNNPLLTRCSVLLRSNRALLEANGRPLLATAAKLGVAA